MKTENLQMLKIHKLSKEQYNRELEAGRIDLTAIYLTPDEELDLSQYATIEQLNTKANIEHTHTIDNITNLQSNLDEMLEESKSYTDTKTQNMVTSTVVDNKISTHNTSTSAHNDIRLLITDLTTKLNNFLDVDDTTTDQLSEVITLINNNKGTLESLTTNKINVSDIVNNLTTNSTSKVLSAAQGVAIKKLIDTLQSEVDNHTHDINDVSGLQNALNGKSDSSHTHDDRYYTETEVNNLLNGKSNTDHTHDDIYYTESEIDSKLSNKADSTHTHSISNVTNLQSSLDAKVPTSRTINGKALTANITLSAADVNADTKGSATSALDSAKSYSDSGDASTLSSAKSYTDSKIMDTELISVEDIDTICGATVQVATVNEVTF